MNNCLSESGEAYGLVTVTYPRRKCSLVKGQIKNNILLFKTFINKNGMLDKHVENIKLAIENGHDILDSSTILELHKFLIILFFHAKYFYYLCIQIKI